ncbi:fatty acid desaturase [Xinfangfangia sp. CPCC 101601]|uniref:Fatty acid desaturase n=1 Tax=Pseudogemmobacter lacusdianii TaxID=3069608 RepID=A0ABU0VVI6_9RHOB|nr:fatty acid desaturase [Xinfangfangia sp. CPCC 101601]MDQ2065663.1 fatty acid desaturase [Xinfangfangia sp. CPCC 101601]
MKVLVLRKTEWPTLLLLACTYAVWALATTWLWEFSTPLAVVILGLAVAQHSSLQHEMLHGHPFRNSHLNHALVFVPLGLLYPYLRFRDTHIAHHRDPLLTDPYDDPESNYLDPKVWAGLARPLQILLRANNTLLGRMVIGPVIGAMMFWALDLRAILKGNRRIAISYLLHGIGLLMLASWWWVGIGKMSLGGYVLGAYLGASLLKIRTYLEHRAHNDFAARTAIVEDRGPLALLFLNNNLHVVHHMNPKVAWYDLPRLYRSQSTAFQQCNEGYVYRSYLEVFGKYFLKAKDPVPHPIYPVQKHQKRDLHND